MLFVELLVLLLLFLIARRAAISVISKEMRWMAGFPESFASTSELDILYLANAVRSKTILAANIVVSDGSVEINRKGSLRLTLNRGQLWAIVSVSGLTDEEIMTRCLQIFRRDKLRPGRAPSCGIGVGPFTGAHPSPSDVQKILRKVVGMKDGDQLCLWKYKRPSLRAFLPTRNST